MDSGKSRGDGFSFTSKIMSAVGTKPDERKTPNPAVGKQGSLIASDMTITGNVESELGAVHVLGQVNGELHVADLVVGAGGKVEGDIFALELTIEGTVNGTIHANNVNLTDSAKVAGDIYHASLKIDRNALFEGMSRRMQTEMGSVKMAQVKVSEPASRITPVSFTPTPAPASHAADASADVEPVRSQNGSGVVNFPGEHSAKM